MVYKNLTACITLKTSGTSKCISCWALVHDVAPQLFLNLGVGFGYLYKEGGSNLFLDSKIFIVRMKDIEEPVRIITSLLLPSLNDNETGPLE